MCLDIKREFHCESGTGLALRKILLVLTLYLYQKNLNRNAISKAFPALIRFDLGRGIY